MLKIVRLSPLPNIFRMLSDLNCTYNNKIVKIKSNKNFKSNKFASKNITCQFPQTLLQNLYLLLLLYVFIFQMIKEINKSILKTQNMFREQVFNEIGLVQFLTSTDRYLACDYTLKGGITEILICNIEEYLKSRVRALVRNHVLCPQPESWGSQAAEAADRTHPRHVRTWRGWRYGEGRHCRGIEER